jgi:hypothetical protein
MEKAELIAKMRSRVERCTRLARSTTDARAATILRAMAEEGEADIARLLNEDAEESGRNRSVR